MLPSLLSRWRQAVVGAGAGMLAIAAVLAPGLAGGLIEAAYWLRATHPDDPRRFTDSP